MARKRRNEGKLTKRCKDYMNSLPRSYFFKVHGATSQVTGIADLIGVLDGKFTAIEIKDPNNPDGASERQKLFLMRVKRAGGDAMVCRSLSALKKRYPK